MKKRLLWEAGGILACLFLGFVVYRSTTSWAIGLIAAAIAYIGLVKL